MNPSAYEYYDRERNRLMQGGPKGLPTGGPMGGAWSHAIPSPAHLDETGKNGPMMMGGPVVSGDAMRGYNYRGGPEFGVQNPLLEAQAAAFQYAMKTGNMAKGTTFQEFAEQYNKLDFKGKAFGEDHAATIMGGVIANRNAQDPNYESPRDKRRREKEEAREQRIAEREKSLAEQENRKQSRLYQDAAGRDFQQQSEAIDRANQERRQYAEGASTAIDDRITQAQESGEDLISNAERLMERGLKDFDKMAKQAIGDLNNQNMQFQAESTAGLRQSISSQISEIDRDPTLTPAQKQQMKSQMQNQVSSQVASVVGQAQRETQQLRSQMRTAFSGQRANLSQGLSTMVQSARVRAMEDNARSLEFAAQGRMALSELMSKPDRVLSEFDSLINIGTAMESQGLDFDAGRFSRRFFENDQRSFEDRMNDRAQNQRFV